MSSDTNELKDQLAKVLALLEGTVGAKSDVTCTQFMTVMLALMNDGMTPREMAERLDVNESTVSRNFAKLGPDGTGCLVKEGKEIKAHQHVIDAVSSILLHK
mgnify:CR=1 FL=1